MTESSPTPAPGTEPSPGQPQPQGKRVGRTIVIVLGALLLLAAVVAAIYGLVSHPAVTATVRDITIIVLALSTTVIGLSLIVLILQLQSLIGLLRDEIRPILISANETARTVRGTTTFLSESVVRPVISVAGYASGIRQVVRLLAGSGKHSPARGTGRESTNRSG